MCYSQPNCFNYLLIDVVKLTDGLSVAVNRGVCVLELHELVAHQCPGREIVGV